VGASRPAAVQNGGTAQRKPAAQRPAAAAAVNRPADAQRPTAAVNRPAGAQRPTAAVVNRPSVIPRQMNTPQGNYVMVQVPAMYAQQMLYYAQQSSLAPQIYVQYPPSPQHPQGYVTPAIWPVMMQNPTAVPNMQYPGVYPYYPQVVQPPPYPGNQQPPFVVKPETPQPTPQQPAPPRPVTIPFPNRQPHSAGIPKTDALDQEKKKSLAGAFLFDDSSDELSESLDESDTESLVFTPFSESDSESEEQNCKPKPPPTVAQEDDDIAFALQLEDVINEDTFKKPKSQKVSYLPSQTGYTTQDAEEMMQDGELSLQEIIHLYKNGEPVVDYVNFYIALHPHQAAQLTAALETEISAQSIITNIQDFYKQCLAKAAQPKVPEDTFDFYEEYDDEEDEDEELYNEEFDYVG